MLVSALSKYRSILVAVMFQGNFSGFNVVLFFMVFKQPLENTFPEHAFFFLQLDHYHYLYGKGGICMVLDCTVLGNERHDVPFEFVLMRTSQSVQQKLQCVKHMKKNNWIIHAVVLR